jgi:ferredoxin-NADP reductase
MLTEPLTSPKRFDRRAWYAVIAAFFFLPQLTIFGFTINPETALLIANLFSFIVSPSFKLDLRLREQTELAPGIFAFNFRKPKWLRHKPGQFMEFTIPVKHSDDRGNRRYFSIASSPTEDTFMFAARFPDRPSAYKRTLEMAQPGDRFIASELSGDFMLPKKRMCPLAFIAGGIGITPFRGMIKYLSDSGERRDVVLFYSNYRAEEIVFDDVLREARDRVGLRVVHTLTDCENVPKDWCGKIGFIDDRMIAEAVPDYDRRHFMISGSLKMVETMKGVLRRLGVPAGRIQTDFFPGYAT